MKQTLFAIAFLLLYALPAQAQSANTPDVRILIVPETERVSIAGMSSQKTANIQAGQSSLKMNGRNAGQTVRIPNDDPLHRIGDRQFRGELSAVWTAPSRFIVVAKLPLEEYLTGLINSEIRSDWPQEAVKAQAVAARTYALSKMGRMQNSMAPKPFDMTSDMFDQMYHGSHAEDPLAFAGVAATRGEVLQKNGAVFQAFYHSCCGGRTEHAHNVWPGEKDAGVTDDAYCARAPKFRWSLSMPVARFAELLRKNGFSIGKLTGVETTALADSPRVDYVLVTDEDGLKMVKATMLRKLLGYKEFQSTRFSAGIKNGSVNFDGQGYGHGVGMCQWGAMAQAQEGRTYREILKFYYPEAEVVKQY